MLEKDAKIEKDDGQIGGYWTTEGHIDLMNDVGEFFSLTDVQECAEDPSSIVQLEDSDTLKSNESIATEGTNSNSTQSYHDLDAIPLSLSTSTSDGSVSQSEWAPFIPLETSTIQIHGNEIRHSPKSHSSQVNSEEGVQVQVPPLRMPIIRRLEDTSKEKPTKTGNRGRKSLENLQRKQLKKKGEVGGNINIKESICKTKGNKRQYRKGRNLESEFEEKNSDPAHLTPTVTIHHHAMQPAGQSSGVQAQAMNNSQMKTYQTYQMYGDNNSSILTNGTPSSQSVNSSVSTEDSLNSYGNSSNTQRGHNIGNSFNQRAQMIPDPRNQWSEPLHHQSDQGKIIQNRENNLAPNVCVNSNGMFSRMQQDFCENSNRAYSSVDNGPPTNSSNSSRNSNQNLCNENHRSMFQNTPERFEQMWSTASLSPVERLFRNRISEVNEVRERCGDVQKFMKNSQLYKQLLAPIKDEVVKNGSRSSESEEIGADVKKIPLLNPEQPSHRYDLPNEWTKVPTVPKPLISDSNRSSDSKLFDSPPNYINFNSNGMRRDHFQSESMMSGNPYEHVSEVNEHFSKNANLHKSEHESGSSSSKQAHRLPNWLKPHTIAKDYEAMFMEILKLRFCIYSERARNDLLQAENVNLRGLMNLQRNFQVKSWPRSSKTSSACDNGASNNGGHAPYFRGEESMEHCLNAGVNGENDMFDPNCVPSVFGQLSRENIPRNGHLQPPTNVYYNSGSDCNMPLSHLPPQQHQQRQSHNFNVMNMMRR